MAKLRGGNGPKEPKVKKEKVMINCGEGGAAKKEKPKKQKKPKKEDIVKEEEEKEEEKPKEIAKMDMSALLGSSKPAGKPGAADGPPMSLADRMKMMREKKDPADVKKEEEAKKKKET